MRAAAAPGGAGTVQAEPAHYGYVCGNPGPDTDACVLNGTVSVAACVTAETVSRYTEQHDRSDRCDSTGSQDGCRAAPRHCRGPRRP
jgi:hypothetical protein